MTLFNLFSSSFFILLGMPCSPLSIYTLFAPYNIYSFRKVNTYINNKNSRGGGGGLTVKEMIVMLMDP